MLNAGVQTEIVNKLIGQEGYLDSSYVRFTDEEIADAYKLGMNSLLIFENIPALTEHTEEINKLKTDNQQLKDELAEIRAKLNEYRLEKLERINGIKKEK